MLNTVCETAVNSTFVGQQMVDTTSVALLNRVHDRTDEDAWSRFDSIYRNFIVRFLRSRQVDDDVAEDVCQGVMKQVYEAMISDGFEHNGRKGAFRNWLRRVVVTQLALVRRKSVHLECPLPAGLDEQLGKDDSRLVRLWDEEHNRTTVNLVLSMLRGNTAPESLEIFRLMFVDGASAEQVAEQFGRTKNAVIVARCKVLKKARQLARELADNLLD